MTKRIDVELLLAESADEALDLCGVRLPDLVFVDATMPTMSGYELCKRLRTLAGERHIDVVFLVDKGQAPDLDKCEGVVDFVTKPFDPDQIRLMTGRLLGIEVEL